MPWLPIFTRADPRLNKRIHWIATCANALFGSLYQFDDLKNNVSQYAMSVEIILVPKRYIWGWALTWHHLGKPQCYWLGTYPNYWNFTYNVMNYPHHLWYGAIGQMGSASTMFDMSAVEKASELFTRTGIWGQPTTEYMPSTTKKEIDEISKKWGPENLRYYFNPETIPKGLPEPTIKSITTKNQAIDKDISPLYTFYRRDQLSSYMYQDFAIKERLKRYKDCLISRGWLPETEPRFDRSPEKGVQPPIIPPPVDKPPMTRVGPEAVPPTKEILNLSLNFGERHGTPYPTLEMQIWFYWS